MFEVALALRILAADALEVYLRRGGRRFLFPDSEIYWRLAETVRDGGLYQIVEWNDVPHFALRAPAYPALIATCLTLFGGSTLAVRLVQAVLGALAAGVVFGLGKSVLPDRGAARAGAWIVALHPYAVLGSVILLSEALFTPLMLAALWGLAAVWEGRGRGVAVLTGAAAGAAVLARPSWALFPPLAVLTMLCARRFQRVWLERAGLVGLGLVIVMAPWWARNYRMTGRFVPTALWFGASLYDGLNPKADGSSDMRFMADQDVWPLDEIDQDQALARRALTFALKNPRRVLELAARKFALYWRPWPSAQGMKGYLAMALASSVELPLFALAALGLWTMRRDPRAWVLLAGPILYFSAVHLVFASSMRYRLPAEPAAMVLAAAGLGHFRFLIFDFRLGASARR